MKYKTVTFNQTKFERFIEIETHSYKWTKLAMSSLVDFIILAKIRKRFSFLYELKKMKFTNIKCIDI